MIHSFDYPELAELALSADRAYAKIAPAAPHALHMPSRIFTRLAMKLSTDRDGTLRLRNQEGAGIPARPGEGGRGRSSPGS